MKTTTRLEQISDKITLFGDRVLINKLRQIPRKGGSGILIPKELQDSDVGEVIRVGGTTKYVTIGDLVSWGKFAGTETVVNGISLPLMRESDIFWKVDEELLNLAE